MAAFFVLVCFEILNLPYNLLSKARFFYAVEECDAHAVE